MDRLVVVKFYTDIAIDGFSRYKEKIMAIILYA